MVVGGVKMAPVWLESASGGGGTLEKSGSVGRSSVDTPEIT